MNFDKDRIDKKMVEEYGLECNPFRENPYYPTDSFTGWYLNYSNKDTKEFVDGSMLRPRLKTTTIGKYWICTIKLPDDPQKTQGYEYETMIMQDEDNVYPQVGSNQFHIPSGQGSGGLEYQERCYTKDEAILQHERGVLYVNKLLGK